MTPIVYQPGGGSGTRRGGEGVTSMAQIMKASQGESSNKNGGTKKNKNFTKGGGGA